AVHTPIQARKDLVEKYKAKTPTNQKNPTYAAMVHSVDDAVGRIMAALDECGVAENTLVIFTSDNGGLLGPTNNAPLRAGKGHPYEGGIREPLIVRWPRVVKAGSTCDVPVTSVDYFPTVCEAAGAGLPKDRPIDGESIVPLLTQTGSLKRDAIFWHFPHYRGGIVPYSIIRAGDWKLIKRYDAKTYELFNLKDDLSETTDLADREPDVVKRLDARLVAHLKAANAKMPKPNPDYQPKKKGK
ncbi:MAG TPA: sulfatase-like hydrolase/transferase, partial [Phycisphaerae bacterium]|nr:sulfatase-like hydrolase/transferase [Phycisphaerae bacterium]